MAEKINDLEGVKKKSRISRNLSPSTWFIILAFVAALGYLAGTYHFQIEAAIGPVFGYKAHSGALDLSSLQETYNELAANFDGKLDTNALIDGANKGLVSAAGDQYTLYMTAKEASDYQKTLSGDIGGGIGAEMGIKNDVITILRLLPDNPAKKAGLQVDDQILSVNDQTTEGWTVERAVSQIRGEEGTTVKLTIKRGDLTKDYNITRAIINNPSVESKIENGIGIITISRFDEQTADLARSAAADLKSKNVKGVIVDLRGNGGGYVNAARDIVGIWVNDKVVVTERTDVSVRDTLKTGSTAILNGVPTAVIIDANSASASEIVAGALQDYRVAKIVGEKSYGKGSVQQLITLNTGAELKVTVAKWYTPLGKNINKEGITPDKKAGMTQSDIDKGIDPQMDAAKQALGL